MRVRIPLLAIAAAAAALVPTATASAVTLAKSDNVKVLGSFNEAAGAIGARFSPDGDTMYVTSAHGLGIYDVSKPESPQRVSRLPIPHFENEDVDVGRVAGKDVVILTNDPSFNLGAYGAIYVIDVTDPAAPSVLSVTPTKLPKQLGVADAHSTNGHIANCIQGCRYVWTTGDELGVTVYDLADPAAPAIVGSFEMPKRKDAKPEDTGGFTHDVFVDKSGIAWVTGEDGTFGFDTNGYVPKRLATETPTPYRVNAPALVYRSDENVLNSGQSGDTDAADEEGVGPTPEEQAAANDYPLDFLHHNSIRTSIQLDKGATPATPAQPGTAPAQPAQPARPTAAQKRKAAARNSRYAKARKACARKRTKRARRACVKRVNRRERAAKRRAAAQQRRAAAGTRTTQGGLGDVVAVTEEDYTRPGCNGQGSVQTWQITGERNSDGSRKLKMLDMWTTELNELQSGTGRSEVTANCSAHWFDESDGVLAQGWYDQGVRFMDISDPRNIRQVGYYVTQGEFWAAYYAPKDNSVVYAMDTAGGIDVLQIDRKGAAKGTNTRTVRAPLDVLKGRTTTLKPSDTWGFACPLVPGAI